MNSGGAHRHGQDALQLRERGLQRRGRRTERPDTRREGLIRLAAAAESREHQLPRHLTSGGRGCSCVMRSLPPPQVR